MHWTVRTELKTINIHEFKAYVKWYIADNDRCFFTRWIFWHLLGMPNPKKIPIFADLTEPMGFYTSKDFLPKVSAASKAGWLHTPLSLPVLFYGEK